jgi:biopolymer transport protein ExbD
MAITLGSSSGGGRGGRRSYGGPAMAEINIIPLVDVVLVLLVIFMLTAHVMEFGLEIEVPKTTQQRQSSEELPVVSLDKGGDIYIADKRAKNIRTLVEEVKARYPNAKAVYVRADKNTTVDPLLKAVAILGAGQLQVRLVTQPDDGGK